MYAIKCLRVCHIENLIRHINHNANIHFFQKLAKVDKVS